MRFVKDYLLYFIPLFLIELLFRWQTNMLALPIYNIRSILFVMSLAMFLYCINQWFHRSIAAVITVITFIFVSVYVFFQAAIHAYYGRFFSMRFLREGAPDVGEYFTDFIRGTDWILYLILLLGILASIAYLRLRSDKQIKYRFRVGIIGALSFVLIYSLYIGSLFIGDTDHVMESSFSLYRKPYYTESAMNQLGVTSFVFTDIQYSFLSDGSIEKPVIKLGKLNRAPISQEDILFRPRIQDDTQWKTVRDNEKNSDLKTIDQYLLSKAYTPENDYTGIYKDKNLIYVLVEAFDMIAIDKDLTPTLYKMQQEGFYFDHFYSPQFNCATAESELMSMTSIYPVMDVCTMSAYYDQSSPQTIFNLFKKAGYTTSSYHNWDDEFYPRSVIHPYLGSDKYLGSDDLLPWLIDGWQSDLTMMEGVVKDLNQGSDRFMAYIVTSSTHLPYDTDTTLGNRYVSQVLTKYPNAPKEIRTYLSKAIELDRALAYLLENLTDIDNTVIALFGDHRPLTMPGSYLDNYSDIDRLSYYELDRTPMIIYSPHQEAERISTVSSTIDLEPTLANMFDLDYDTRLFMGSDIMSEEKNMVIFQNGSWYDQVGYFDVYAARFYPYDTSLDYSSDEISVINNTVRNKLYISSLIYTENYFNQRAFLRK